MKRAIRARDPGRDCAYIPGDNIYTPKDNSNVGPIPGTEETRDNIPLTPIVDDVALVGGILLLVVCAKEQR